MATWNTMHVFGYGQSQMIGPAENGIVLNSALTTIDPLISYLATIQQEGTSISIENLFALNLYNDMFLDFLPNENVADNKMQRFDMADIDTSYVTNLADEVSNLLA